MVIRKISDNRFTIKTDRPGVEVSWQVTGIRHDSYANKYRIPVEEEKSESDAGDPEVLNELESLSRHHEAGPVKRMAIGRRAPQFQRRFAQCARGAEAVSMV